MSKLQKKPSALKRGHPTLQNMNFYIFFSTFVGHFCPSGSVSTGPIESGSNPDPDPKRCLNLYIYVTMSNLSGDPVPLSGKISKFSADQEPEIRTVAELLAKHPEKRSECVKNLHRNVEVSSIFNIRKFYCLNVVNSYIF
jgi:hypothetical protein